MKKAVQAYIVAQDLGELKEGDVLHIDADKAQPLVDAGILTEATEEDVNGGQDDDQGEGEMADAPEQNAAVTRAIASLSKTLESNIAKATELAVSKVNKKTNNSIITVPATPKKEVFRCMGEMLQSVVKARNGDRRAMNMLAAHQEEIRLKAPLGSNEGTNTQGGYAVKPVWYDRIWDKIREYPKLLEKTERISINSNTLNIPALNETSLADGSRHGGVLAYWVTEGNTATSSYPALTQVQAILNTQVVLVYVTNQLLQDANIEAFDQFIGKKVALEFLWQENNAVVNGSGSGQPTGVLNQPALVTVAKSTNDTNAMFGFDDLANMYKSLYPPSRANAVWLMNPEAYSVFIRQVFVTASGTATTYPAFGGVSYNAADEFPLKIFGRPVIENMSNPQLGLPGDIALVDLSQLVTAEQPGMQADVSYEIQFTSLQTCFRFVRRYDIKSPWTAALTSVDGHYSYSPFVVLASRGT
jgi:HK97 family phage major capsid protein